MVHQTKSPRIHVRITKTKHAHARTHTLTQIRTHGIYVYPFHIGACVVCYAMASINLCLQLICWSVRVARTQLCNVNTFLHRRTPAHWVVCIYSFLLLAHTHTQSNAHTLTGAADGRASARTRRDFELSIDNRSVGDRFTVAVARAGCVRVPTGLKPN